jgi:hypothetical protein
MSLDLNLFLFLFETPLHLSLNPFFSPFPSKQITKNEKDVSLYPSKIPLSRRAVTPRPRPCLGLGRREVFFSSTTIVD